MHRDDPKTLAAAQGTRRAERTIRAPRGTECTAKSWLTEAPLRMLMNNLDPDVAENPQELVVYGGIGRAARNWECFDAIVAALRDLNDDESLLIQSGKPVGVFKTHADAPRVLIANSNLVPKWATWEHFNELDRKGLMMYGQMTAGSWIYIGSQGIVQGTYETFAEAGRQHFGGDLADKWILTAGLGGMGGAQPLAATMAGASMLAIECQPSRIDMRLRTRYLDKQAKNLDDALAIINDACAAKKPGERWSGRQRGRDSAGTGQAQRQAAHGDGPDVRARSRQRLPARRLDGRTVARPRSAIRRSTRRWSPRPSVVQGARRRDARLPRAGHPDVRLRQQHPAGRARRRPRQCVRLSRFRARRTSGRCSAKARGRFAGSRCPAIPRTSTRRTARSRNSFPATRTCIAGSTWRASASRSRDCRRAFAGSGLGERHRAGLAFNAMVASGELKAPIVIGRDHLDTGSVASPNRETEAMLDGSDAVSDWPLLNALLNTAGGATWVSLHHGGGVGMGYSQHAGVVIVCDGTGCRGEAHRTRAVERSCDGRDATCRCRLCKSRRGGEGQAA